MSQADLGQGLHRTRLGVRHVQAQDHVLPGTFPGHQARLLEHRRPRLWHQQLAAVDTVEPGQAAQQGGLS
ncbi:hypothetical protein D9M71_788540 [compost metagenome]